MTLLPHQFRSFVSEDEPLARHTTLAVGGPARWFARVDRRDDLVALVRYCVEQRIPLLHLGAGSNVLFSDRGFAGCVVHLGGEFAEIEQSESGAQVIVRAGGAVKLGKLLRYGFDHGLRGLQACAGIPGSVGGAVLMNAGSKLGEIRDSFLDCELLHHDGQLEVRDRAAMDFHYRHSSVAHDELVLAARFVTTRGPVEELRAEVERFLEFRKATQPLQFHNCGSVFTNPPGDAAGRLIDACGLKGTRIGGAEIAEQHANWILNRNGASATDVLALIQLAQSRVYERFGIFLETELRLLGDWSASERASIRTKPNDTSYSRGEERRDTEAATEDRQTEAPEAGLGDDETDPGEPLLHRRQGALRRRGQKLADPRLDLALSLAGGGDPVCRLPGLLLHADVALLRDSRGRAQGRAPLDQREGAAVPAPRLDAEAEHPLG